MQQLIGRVTSNARVAHLKDGREVVNFSIAMNDSYKKKNETDITKVVTFVDCAYWMSPKVAQWVTKGSLVEVYGRMGVKVYSSSQGEAKASLVCHVQNIKIHGQGKDAKAEAAKPEKSEEAKDDL